MVKLVAGLLPLSVILAGLSLLAQGNAVLNRPASASSRPSATGRISGRVLGQGTAKAAVAVMILRQDGQVLQKVYSGADGRYVAVNLPPGVYAATVLDPGFLPFWKSAINVVAGAEVVLDIPLLSLAESLQVGVPASPQQTVDDWKWVLRSANPTRPLLRFLPVSSSSADQASGDGADRTLRGTLQLLAGNDGSGFGQDPGLSTFFDMAYAMDGDQWIGLAGSAGWARDTPAASVRASWNRRTDAGTSSVSFTMRQVYLVPGDYRADTSLSADTEHSAISGTGGYKESEDLSDHVQMQYGSLFDAMNFDGLLTRWSPFARVTYTPAANESLTFAYNAASPSVLPFDGNQDYHASEQWLAIPQVSAGPDGKPVMEGGNHEEARWDQALGSRFRYEAAVYYDDISNSALSLALVHPSSPLAGELLQDPFSSRYFLSAGELTSPGARVAISAKLGGNTELIAGYDYSGTLEAGSAELTADSAAVLRDMLVTRRDPSYVVKLKSSIPWSHTQVISSYRWLPRDAVALPDPYDRGWSQAGPYLNLLIAQPIPSPYILQGQFQAVAEFDNLLAQGYLPVLSADGGLGYLFPSARAFRGGLNFIF